MSTLEALRQNIDAIDAQLIALLAQRFALTGEVGHLKKQYQLPATDSAREAAQMARIETLAAQHGLDAAFAQRFLRLVIDEVVTRHKQHYVGRNRSEAHCAECNHANPAQCPSGD